MSIEVGSKLSGKITGITNFGAFVLLPGGETGLVHISEVSNSYVKEIREHLQLNQEVTVKVINVDPSGKIGLSIRQADDSAPAVRPTRDSGHRGRSGHIPHRMTFEDKMSRFMKDSEERLQALRRSESKRGGRGGRRG
ncbi:MAG: S1 domain-containing RNA-binding protein [Alicyclobacillaceae bacterium]|jgi:S1 RNA binding domain protein|uniref:S1 domain-containing RNA-binding protein n=1 Tax=Alicyclobacillus sp. SP_1 TaxID=2942475 RepID=UPI002157930F|nr:S1 domain-containing RNA-binding protein [Alicyclobacillus sp. SP_1]MCY0887853.1 S1 domain-containing RNA-binding protein [Alicyclobacillaceae bacterium]MCY0896132.1 S1 domain-containing RNA-binding protein [Alicyclobacillaceae bacterium]